MRAWDAASRRKGATAAPPTAEEGVTSYPASFFAARQPSNAEDMVTRLPGFTIDDGSGVRGYEGAAGNVLVDGQRPATKNDALVEILRRIPANDVLKIEVIRGGAPGIDMQGRTVLANVIRKQKSGAHGTVAVGDSYLRVTRHLLAQQR